MDDLVAGLHNRESRWLKKIANRFELAPELVRLLDDVDYDQLAKLYRAAESNGFYRGAVVYLRRSAGNDIYKILAHEGTHALDFAPQGLFGRRGLTYDTLSPPQRFVAETRAFRSERLVQPGYYPHGSYNSLVRFILSRYDAALPPVIRSLP